MFSLDIAKKKKTPGPNFFVKCDFPTPWKIALEFSAWLEEKGDLGTPVTWHGHVISPICFFPSVTSHTYSIRLTANLRAQIDSGDPGLLFGYHTILQASIAIEIIAVFRENSPILRKFDFFTPCDLKFGLIKNDLMIFCRTCRGLSNAVYRLSLSFLVFEFSGGSSAPPPPAIRR